MNSNVYFTSDWHLYHKNIIKYSNRPFNNTDEMMYSFIDNWNKQVTKKDSVYFLGDFAFCSKRNEVENILKILNGNKFLIKGNHDNDYVTKAIGWSFVKDIYNLKYDNHHMVLCHYPFLSWNRAEYYSWNLHGHTHGNLKVDLNLLSHDVGIDNNNYNIVSYEYIKNIMEKKKDIKFIHSSNDRLEI